VFVALKAESPDFVHIQYQTAAYGMHPAICLLPVWLRHRGLRVVTTFHDLREPYVFPKAGRLRHWLTSTLARFSDGVIAITPEDQQLLETWVSGTEASPQVRGIPIGSNIQAPAIAPTAEERKAFRARFRLSHDAPLLGYFGLLNQSKGLDTLVASFSLLRGSLADCRLLIIGGETGASDPNNQQTKARFLRSLANEGLDGSVVFTGHLLPSEVSLALASVDVCMLPYHEGVSLRRGSLMAALSHGCAIVTTRRDLPQTLDFPAVRDGEHALLAPPADVRALADACHLVLRDFNLRTRLSNGAKALSDSFTWDKIALAHLSLYRGLLERHHLNTVSG
jgi:glycosyltransferase involved in cell wall biosynthesis